jgi:superfamily I DNA/RNA helicase
VLVEGEEHLRSILAEDIEAWRVFLHPYQRKLKEWDVQGPIKISGAAGTGKTVVLMHRAVHLAERLADEKDRVLVTTFSANLSVTIEDLIRKLSPTAAKRIEVTNLHQLARTICLRASWQGRVADEQDLNALWEAVFTERNPASVDAGAFDRPFIRQEYDEVVDAMGIDSEEEYLTAARTGRSRLSRQQRRKLWVYFQAFNRLLQKRGLLTFEGTVHQARLIVERGGFARYRHVLVDELQDFGLEGLRLIASLSRMEKDAANPLCVVGDGHQRISRHSKVPLLRAGINVVGRSRRLKINYRTSEQIRQWAHSLLDGMDIDDLDGGHADTTGDRSVFKGPKPKAIKVSSREEAGTIIANWVKDLCDSQQLGSHEICVTPVFGEVRSALAALDIPSLELQPSKADPGRIEPGVRLGGMRRIKGLEFKAVAMIFEDQTQDQKRLEHYVAATRARQWLLVVECG